MIPPEQVRPRRYTLQPRVDLAVYYAADSLRSLQSRVVRPNPAAEPIGQQYFIDFYADHPSIGFACDGEPIGGVIIDRAPHGFRYDSEVHIAILPAHHGRWTTLLEPALAKLFDFEPRFWVALDADNQRALKFMRDYGWPEMALAQPLDSAEGEYRPAKVQFLMSRALWPTLRRRRAAM